MMDFARRAPAVIGTIRNESEVENVCAPPGERVGITGVGQEAAPRMVSAHSTDRIDQFKPHSVSTRRLAMFLLDSWSHRIEQDLEATEEDRPDTLGTTDEPLDSSPLSQTRLRGILFPALMRAFWNGKSLAEIRDLAEKTHARSLWSGEAPEGIQARREGRDLMAWVDEIGRLVSKLRATWPDHRLETGCGLDLRAQGRPSEWALEIPGMGSVRLAARIPVALVGPHEDSPAILISASRAGSKAPRFAFRKRVEPLLWAHLLRRLGHPEVHVILVPLNRGEAEELPAISVPDGSTWLEEVLHDLLSGAHEHLPAGLVVDGGRTTLDALREGIEENTYASEIERLLEPDLPGESREDGQILTRLVERRLGPFLSANPDKEDES